MSDHRKLIHHWGFRALLVLVGFSILALKGCGEDASGRLAFFGQPLMVYLFLGIPVLILILCLHALYKWIRNNVNVTKLYKKSDS